MMSVIRMDIDDHIISIQDHEGVYFLFDCLGKEIVILGFEFLKSYPILVHMPNRLHGHWAEVGPQTV